VLAAPTGLSINLTYVSPHGTVSYEGLTDLPPLVERAVDLAHPAVDATQFRLAPDLAAMIVTRRFPG
jgi:hypothetical protein